VLSECGDRPRNEGGFSVLTPQEISDQIVHHVFLQPLPLFRSRDFREGVMAYLEKRMS
jgi:hypothetical protein